MSGSKATEDDGCNDPPVDSSEQDRDQRPSHRPAGRGGAARATTASVSALDKRWGHDRRPGHHGSGRRRLLLGRACVGRAGVGARPPRPARIEALHRVGSGAPELVAAYPTGEVERGEPWRAGAAIFALARDRALWATRGGAEDARALGIVPEGLAPLATDRALWTLLATTGSVAFVRIDGEHLTGHLLFTAEDPAWGRETFISDGTARGTSVLFDLSPGRPGSFPRRPGSSYAAAGDSVYFIGHPPEAGGEPWRIPRAALAPASPDCTSDESCPRAPPGFARRCVSHACVVVEDPDTPSLELEGCHCDGAGRSSGAAAILLGWAASCCLRRRLMRPRSPSR